MALCELVVEDAEQDTLISHKTAINTRDRIQSHLRAFRRFRLLLRLGGRHLRGELAWLKIGLLLLIGRVKSTGRVWQIVDTWLLATADHFWEGEGQLDRVTDSHS